LKKKNVNKIIFHFLNPEKAKGKHFCFPFEPLRDSEPPAPTDYKVSCSIQLSLEEGLFRYGVMQIIELDCSTPNP